MNRERLRKGPSYDQIIAFVVFLVCILYSIMRNVDLFSAIVGIN